MGVYAGRSDLSEKAIKQKANPTCISKIANGTKKGLNSILNN
jgi:hypothetical protein